LGYAGRQSVAEEVPSDATQLILFKCLNADAFLSSLVLADANRLLRQFRGEVGYLSLRSSCFSSNGE